MSGFEEEGKRVRKESRRHNQSSALLKERQSLGLEGSQSEKLSTRSIISEFIVGSREGRRDLIGE